MNLPTRQDLEARLIKSITASQSKVTYFGEGGVVRSIVAAIAMLLMEVYYFLYVSVRALFPSTATGADLDNLGAQLGVPRKTQNAASVVAVFSGANGNTVPQGTRLQSTVNGLTYTVDQNLSLGAINPVFNGQAKSVFLGNAVTVTCTTLGSAGRTPANSLIMLDSVSGTTGVVNPLPSVSGDDDESDADYSVRLGDAVGQLAQGTQQFFEMTAANLDNRIAAVKAQKNPYGDGADIYLLSKSLAGFTDTELQGFASQIYSMQRAYNTVNVYNAGQQGFWVSLTVTLADGVTLARAFSEIADAVASVINPTAGFGVTIRLEDLIAALQPIADFTVLVQTLTLGGLNRDVQCASMSVPVFSALVVRETAGGTVQTAQIAERMP